MPKPTRLRIIEYLNKHTSSSSEELSNALSMSKENILYHLKRLASDGMVIIDRSMNRQGIKRGRPTLYYRLDAPDYPSNIIHLADCLLQQLLFKNASDNDQQIKIHELSQIMFKPIESSNLSQTIQKAMKKLNDHHYQASWEARLNGPRVYFRNCPYAALLVVHPELCEMDKMILETLVGKPSRLVTWWRVNGYCAFDFFGV